jgi:plastocyanin
VTLSFLGVGKTSKLPRSATLRTVASASSAISLAFDPAAEIFRYVHEGKPANHTVELSSFDANGRATKFMTPTARINSGDTVTFRPDWNQLVEGAGTLNIHTGKGEESSRPLK